MAGIRTCDRESQVQRPNYYTTEPCNILARTLSLISQQGRPVNVSMAHGREEKGVERRKGGGEDREEEREGCFMAIGGMDAPGSQLRISLCRIHYVREQAMRALTDWFIQQGLTSPKHIISHIGDGFLRVNSVKALKEDRFLILGFNPIRSTPPCSQ